MSPPLPRYRLRLRGAVQGVGMRPYVYGLARAHALTGFVRNDAEGVLCEIEGARAPGFIEALRRAPPPLARIDALEVETVAPLCESGFRIETSRPGEVLTRIPADAAVCDACLDELFDPASRFHRYPFVNCTHCGPRWTIARRLPYDRPQTSMAAFPLCDDCARDYADPASRRFHAQPIACPACGPKLSHPVEEIVTALTSGGIVALKGIGGFQLMCDATNEDAVATLRRRKGRDAKPFAVMVADAATAQRIAGFDAVGLSLLTSPARPIVLGDKRGALAPSLAPGLMRLGVMLPCAPLHHLLFEADRDACFVATSANPGGAPLIVDDAEARAKLAEIADLVVGHDRAIVARADDSVMCVIDGAAAFLRRARGFVPEPIALADDGPATLALGAHLKTTVTVTRGREAFVSTHVGGLDNRATIDFHAEIVARMLDMLGVTPEIVACDLHPDFYTSRLAKEFGVPVVPVQHHAAHVAAVAAEHGVAGPVLGAALDGHGHGDDGGAWGGELMLVDGGGWRRIGALSSLPLPGGDRAAREPWRMGVAALVALGRSGEAAQRFPGHPHAEAAARLALSPATAQSSSLGRLFDAAAALLGVRLEQSYEGQAAMELEALADAQLRPSSLRCARNDVFVLTGDTLDFAPLLALLLEPGFSPHEGAALFHGAVIEGLAQWITRAAHGRGYARVALGGGCMANRILAEGLACRLRENGIEPLLAHRLPAGDGGLSLGQAVLARARVAVRPEPAT